MESMQFRLGFGVVLVSHTWNSVTSSYNKATVLELVIQRLCFAHGDLVNTFTFSQKVDKCSDA